MNTLGQHTKDFIAAKEIGDIKAYKLKSKGRNNNDSGQKYVYGSNFDSNYKGELKQAIRDNRIPNDLVLEMNLR